MKANSNQIMKRAILSLVFGAGLLLLSPVNATAHTIKYRPYYLQDHYVYAKPQFFPAWLRRNRDFQRWYLHSRFRYKRRLSWHRMYDIYLLEKRHRWYGRRIYDKVYRAPSYRSYYREPGRHRH